MGSGGFSSDDLLRQARESLSSHATDEESASRPGTTGAPEPTVSPAARESGRLTEPRRPSPSPDAPVPPRAWRPAPAPQSKRRWGLRRVLRIGGLGIVGVVFVAGVLDDSTAVQDLEAGTCFNDPNASVVYEIDPVDCAEPHHYEVFGNVTLAGDAFPGDEAAWEAAMRRCIALFEGYVGTDYDASAWWVDAFTPTADAWEQGDHGANCVVFQPLGETELRSLTGTARQSGV